jgi:hypothetical protein
MIYQLEYLLVCQCIGIKVMTDFFVPLANQQLMPRCEGDLATPSLREHI